MKNKFPEVLRFIITLFLLLTIFNTIGCQWFSQTQQIEEISQTNIVNSELVSNRNKWQEAKINNYNLKLSKFGGGNYGWVPISIQVRNNQNVSTKSARKREQLERIDGYDEFNTIEKMFDKIQEAYERKYSVNVTYDKEFGYPKTIAIDDLKNSDSAFAIEISNFEKVD